MFKPNRYIFRNIEIMMLIITGMTILFLFTLHLFPQKLAALISILLAQRIIEFVIVYSRNFIHNKGRIFTHFENVTRRGEWLIIMFSLNVTQITFIFATWYRYLSIVNPFAFGQELSAFDSLYFSAITFLTIGYGDITPISVFPKFLVLLQGAITFYTLVIVINGLITIHFVNRP
jgi:hypothetical protein